MSATSGDDSNAVQLAAGLIKNSHHTVVLTGAGMSTHSGIPDFRTPGKGLWTQVDPMEVASLSAFRHHPDSFYQWFHPVAVQLFNAQPNAAHTALARLEAEGYIETIITQNIDGLHTRAGSSHVLEVHGTLNTLTCTDCYKEVSASTVMDIYISQCCMPHCPDCGGVLKPNVILYEEQLPVKIWAQAEEACKKCDLLLVAGTSLEVMPTARLPIQAMEHAAKLIIVNNSPTFMDGRADLVIHADVTEVLPQITSVLLET